MKYAGLIFAALLRRKLRTTFTLLSVAAAFLLFGLSDSVGGAFAHAGEGAPGANRMITVSKYMSAVLIPLPKSLYSRIQSVPGVVGVSYQTQGIGTYQDDLNDPVPILAFDSHWLDLYPEWSAPPDELEAFRETRTGALVGETVAKKYHWKVGDKISLKTNVYQKNGSNIWTFDIVGIYRITHPNFKVNEGELYVSWDFFDEARTTEKGTVGLFVFKAASLDQEDQIARAVDSLSANSDHETKTQSQHALIIDYNKRFADVGAIVGLIISAVFFTLILLTGNEMAQAVRDRIPELATLKAIGFPAHTILGLVLGESVLLLVIGSALGLGITMLAVGVVRPSLILPMLPVSEAVWLRGMGLAIIIGLVAGALPAVRGMRLPIVDALAGR